MSTNFYAEIVDGETNPNGESVSGGWETVDEHRRPNGLHATIRRANPFDCIEGHCPVEGCPADGTHGRGPAEYAWSLAGEGLAIRWSWFSDEHHPASLEALEGSSVLGQFPMSNNLGIHSITPRFPDQPQQDACDLLGVRCYYDVGYLIAKPPMEAWKAGGPEAAWTHLEQFWIEELQDLTTRTVCPQTVDETS